MKTNHYVYRHPTIKRISIGDKFILENGEIVTFVRYDPLDMYYPFVMNHARYTNQLTYSAKYKSMYDIKHRYFSLKDKLELL